MWLLIGSVLMFAGSIAVAMDRWLAVRRIGLALAVVGLLVVAICVVARPLVIARFTPDDARHAAGSLWDAFVSDLYV